jgi:hypothetical protein
MALDATVGGTSANSYMTLAEANTYMADRLHIEAWDDLDDKNQALILASSMLDWYVPWEGTKTATTQAMAWPRTSTTDADGEDIDTDIIPNLVKIATAELALSIAGSDRTADYELAGLKSIQAGSLKLQTDSYGRNDPPDAIPEKVWKILRPICNRTTGKVGIVRLGRA